jgi:hypothetical protein
MVPVRSVLSVVGVAEVAEVREAVIALARDLDPALLYLADAGRALGHATAMKNAAATMEALLAKRVADAGDWKRTGAKSAAEHLATMTGTTIGRARDALSTAERLNGLDATAAAARGGELSPEQAAAVSDAAAVDAAAEGRLLGHAAGAGSLEELRDACAKVKAAADPDPDATYDRNRKARLLRIYTGPAGITKIFGQSTPDQMARIRTAVETRADELFGRARRSGEHEPREAYLMDALDQICSEYLAARDGSPATSTAASEPEAKPKRRRSLGYLGLVRVDHAALVRGRVEGDEVCEIDGLGPVPVRIAREALGDDSLLYLLVTKGTAVASLVNLKRGPTQAQRMALLWGGARCDVEGCTSPFIQIDHTEDWARTRQTVLADLGHMCTFHHKLKTEHGWDLVPGTRRRPMVPPDDPRHPRNARTSAA